MSLRKEHQRLKEFWNRTASKRVQAESQFRYSYDFYERYKEQLREPFLDIGCGDGELLEFLIKDGKKEVYGVDISEVAIELAKEKLRSYIGDEAEERLKVGDMLYLSQYYNRGSLNTIICEGTLHQTTYNGAKLTVVEISQILSDEGLVYASVRSDSTPPKNADLVEGEIETYRLRDKGGIVRCYFSEQGLRDLVEDKFEILELEEKDLLTRIEKESYKMRILVMRKRLSL